MRFFILNLLAQSTADDRRLWMRDSFVKEQLDPATWINLFHVMLGMGSLALLLYVIYLVQKRKDSPPPDDPKRLFRQVLRDTALLYGDRELLTRISRSLDLEHPTVIMLNPALFDYHATAWLDKQGLQNTRVIRQLERLRDRLFPAGAGALHSTPKPRISSKSEDTRP